MKHMIFTDGVARELTPEESDLLARTPLAGQVLVLDAPVQVPGLPVNHFQETVPLAAFAQ